MIEKEKFKSLQNVKFNTHFLSKFYKTLSRLINMRIINLDKVELTIDKKISEKLFAEC